jgi:hypothetical protein
MNKPTKLSLYPQKINNFNWYYEEHGGICVIHEVRDENGEHTKTDRFMIPWHKLRKSLKRNDSIK